MEYKYKAFISYRRTKRDSAVAQALQKMLEQYVVPAEFCENGRNKLGAIFRDRTHIDADPSLRQIIYDALDSSEFLIVICSEDILNPEHPWVQEEIRYFLKAHPDARNRILTIFAGDSPEASIPRFLWMNDGALEPELPNYVDIHGKNDRQRRRNLREQLPKLCTSLLFLKNDKLAMREKVRKRKRNVIVAALLSLVIGYLFWSNIQFAKNNRELAQQNDELLLRESEILTMNALDALDDGDRLSALSYSISALPSSDQERPYYAPAERAVLSALQPFREAEKNYIFSGITLEQTTAVQDLCVSTDGKRLVTADGYHTLHCFDTVTGTLLWKRTISEGRSNHLSQLFLFASYGSVVYCNGSTVASVSLETGEILWCADTTVNEANLYIPCEEAGYLATVTRYHRQSTDSRIFFMTILSLLDGTVTAEIPIAEGANRAHFDPNPEIHFPEIDNHDLRPYTVYSGGRYILSTYDASGSFCHYFCVDTQEQTCVELYESDHFDSNCGDIYGLELIDEGRSLVVVGDHILHDDQILVQRISLEDRSVLWQQVLPVDGSGGVYLSMSGSVILAADNKLSRLDPENGETDSYMETDAPIKDITMVGDNTYAFLLEDGRTTIGWFDWQGFHDIGSVEGEQIDLGSCSMGRLWNGGSIRMEFEDTEYKTFRMSDEDSGGGFAVTVPDDSGNRVIVHRPEQVPVLQTGGTEKIVEDVNSSGFQMCGQDSMVFFDIPLSGIHYRLWHVLDPTTLELKTAYLSPWDLTDDETLFLPDGSSFLVTDYQTIELFVPDTMSFRLLSEAEDGTVPEPGADPVPESSHAVSSVRLSSSGDILSAAVTDTGLFLWRNGSYLRRVEYPMQQEDPDYWSRFNVIAGANGFVAIWYGGDDEPWTFYVYDICEDVWHRIHTYLSEADYDAEVRLGSKEPIIAVFMFDGTIQVFDILTGTIRAELSTGFSQESVRDILLCRNDTAMAFFADGNLYIYDLSSARMVFSEPVNWSHFSSISCYEDPEKNYLFFCNDTIDCEGIWLSTEDWRVLSEISNFLAYNDHTDTIFRLKISEEWGTAQLYASAFPTTEELIALGREFLGE